MQGRWVIAVGVMRVRVTMRPEIRAMLSTLSSEIAQAAARLVVDEGME